MRIQETVVNIIFDAGKGRVSVASREGVSGAPFGELPKPSRSGYAFEGWYLDGKEITSETVLDSQEDVRLVAKWVKKAGEAKKPSVMRSQKIVAFALAISIVFLGIAIAIANNLVAIYYIRDEYQDAAGEIQTERYTLKRRDGLYCMFNKDGVEMTEIKEHSYQSSTDGVYYKVYEADISGNQYMINTTTGEYELFAVVDYDSDIGETLGGTVKNKRIMIFPRVGQDNTYSIKVSNQYGSYEIYRQNVPNTDASKGTKYTTEVRIRGTEGTLTTYDPTLFASLCVSCGYTLSMQKLDFNDPETPRDANGNVRYEDYGLKEVYDENGNLTYAPAIYTIVKAAYATDGQCSPAVESVLDENGQWVERTVEYTVTVGYPILSGGGYYVQLQGRDAVYIVSSDIADTVMQPVESLVTPTVVYPMTMTTYVMPYNFRLGSVSGELGDLPESGDDVEIGDKISLIASFNYKDLTERENSVESSVPYINQLNFMNGYDLNSNSVSAVLEKIYSMEFLGCKKLNPTDEDIKKYGLDKDVYFITFDYDPAIANGGSEKENWVQNMLLISQRTAEDTHYVYAPLYDMIVEVDRYYFSFLDWDESDWYNQYFFQNNIAYMKNMSITVGGKTYDFTFDNRFSYAYYDKGDGTGAIIDLSKGTLSQTSEGGYVYTVTKTNKQYNVYFIDFSKTVQESGKTVYKGPGDSGTVTVQVSLGSSNLQMISPQYSGTGGLMNYVITVEEDSGYTGTTKTKTYTATDNFRRFYSKLLWFSIEGDADANLFNGDIAGYIKNNDPVMEISYSLEDMASILNPKFETNNKEDAIVRFYEYPNGSEMKYLLTIQVADSNGTYGEELGRFYVSAEGFDDLDNYLEDLMNGVLLPGST